MLWPEGPANTLAGIGRFLDPPVDEPIISFCISRPSYYLVAISSSVLAVYRLKPLSPVTVLQLTTDQIEEFGTFTHVCASYNGSHIAVASSKHMVRVFEVGPLQDLDEVLRVRPAPPAGPGEALGTRELSLKTLATLQSREPVISLRGLESALVVASPTSIQFCSWQTPELAPVNLHSIQWPEPLSETDVIEAVGHSTLLGRLSVRLNTGQSFIIHLNEKMQTEHIPQPPSSNGHINGHSNAQNNAKAKTEPALAPAFNLRFGKVAISEGNKVYLYSIKHLSDHPVELELPMFCRVTCLEWSISGTVLFVGTTQGWSLITVLGVVLFTDTGMIQETVEEVEWSLSSDELLILSDGVIKTVGVLRLVSPLPDGLSHPVLYGNGRLLVFHDPSRKHLTRPPWLHIPLPSSYLSESWPIVTASCSPDGRYVAAAGTHGLVCFSVAQRTWKRFTDADFTVRGSIVWYGHLLVVPVVDPNGMHVLKLYSPVNPDEEEQVLASKSMDSPITAMTRNDDSLWVLTQAGSLLTLDLKEHSLDVAGQVSLSTVLTAPGRVRSLTVLDNRRYLFLVDDRLVLVTVENEQATKFRRHTLAAPIEYYYYANPYVWIFDGQEITAHTIDEELSPPIFSSPLDAYPVGISVNKGVFVTIESEATKSVDGSFLYSGVETEFVGYLPLLLGSQLSNPEQALKTAEKYTHLTAFDQVLETMLYQMLVDNDSPSQLRAAFELITKFPHWQRIVADCARKTETKYWPKLFDIVGQRPEQLFEEALEKASLETASEYLMVLHAQGTAEPGDERTVRLFQQAQQSARSDICKQLIHFLYAVDTSGKTLRGFKEQINLMLQ